MPTAKVRSDFYLRASKVDEGGEARLHELEAECLVFTSMPEKMRMHLCGNLLFNLRPLMNALSN